METASATLGTQDYLHRSGNVSHTATSSQATHARSVRQRSSTSSEHATGPASSATRTHLGAHALSPLPPSVAMPPATSDPQRTSTSVTTEIIDTTAATSAGTSMPVPRTRAEKSPNLLQRFTRLLIGGTSKKREKDQQAGTGAREARRHAAEKPVDGVSTNAEGRSVIVDYKAYLKAVRRNLPESLERAYVEAVYLHQRGYGQFLEPRTFQVVCKLIHYLARDKKCCPREGKNAILQVSQLYLGAAHCHLSLEEVDAVIAGLLQEQLLRHTVSRTHPGILFDTSIAVAVHPVMFK